MESYQIAILAGGMATRLGDVARHQPKSMVMMHGKPFLQHQLEFLKGSGITRVVLCLGYLGEQIEHYFGDGRWLGMDIKYSREDKPLGTAGALKKADGLLDDVFFTIYGDSYVFLDFAAVRDYFQSRDKLALMTVYRNQDRYDSSNTVVRGELVTGYSKQHKQADMVYIEYGVDLFRKAVLSRIPAQQFYALEELFPRLIQAGELLAYEVKERFYEIGSPGGLKEFEAYIA